VTDQPRADIERFEITVGSLTFQARRAGPPDGRPVLLLHGVPQSSACWIRQLHALGLAGYRAVAFTQRGYSPGARIDAVEAYTMDLLADDALGVADKLGFGRFDVVGHDAGAGVAWTLGGYHSDRVRTLTIVSVPHPAAFADSYHASQEGGDDDQYGRSAYMRRIIERPRGETERLFLANDKEILRTMFADLPPESVDEYFEIVGTPEGLRGALDWYRANALRRLGRPNGMSPDFPDITVPTLYVWSDQDPALGATAAYATERYVKAPYRFVVLEGVGHWIPEIAADRFNQELLAHLDAHASPA